MAVSFGVFEVGWTIMPDVYRDVRNKKALPGYSSYILNKHQRMYVEIVPRQGLSIRTI